MSRGGRCERGSPAVRSGGGALLVLALVLACGNDEPPPAAPPPPRDHSADVAELRRRGEEDLVLFHQSAVEVRPPYVVFAEYSPVPGDRARAETVAVEQAALLSTFYEGVRSLLGEPLDLPRVEERGTVEARWLPVSVLDSLPHEAYWSPAQFRAEEGWLLIDGRRESGRSWEPSESLGRERVLYQAARQLLHAFGRTAAGEELRSHWFEVGLAMFLGLSGVSEDGTWGPRPSRLRLQEWRFVRKAGLPDWPLGELLAVRFRQDLRREAREVGGLASAHMVSLFRGQSWAFVHYLWHFENGKHREKLLRYAREQIQGRAGPDAFARALFGDRPVDWSGVEVEWNAHVRALWNELEIE